MEIKMDNTKKKNSLEEMSCLVLSEAISEANLDDRVKCVVLHGGKNFCSGFDVEVFQLGREDKEYISNYANRTVYALFSFLNSLLRLEKPLVIFVRGPAVGLGFTMLPYADFVYCTPDA